MSGPPLTHAGRRGRRPSAGEPVGRFRSLRARAPATGPPGPRAPRRRGCWRASERERRRRHPGRPAPRPRRRRWCPCPRPHSPAPGASLPGRRWESWSGKSPRSGAERIASREAEESAAVAVAKERGSRSAQHAGRGRPAGWSRVDQPDQRFHCGIMVRKGGLEPPRPCGHWTLNPARLPIPPLPHRSCSGGPGTRYYSARHARCQSRNSL